MPKDHNRENSRDNDREPPFKKARLELENASQDQLNAKLFNAVKNNDIELVKAALDQGASIDSKNKSKQNFTALHKAAQKGYINIVELLLDRGAHINAKAEMEDRGWTPTTPEEPSTPFTPLNEEEIQGTTPLHEAVEKRRIGVVKILLDRGAQFDIKDNYGKIAFMRIFENLETDRSVAIAKYLLSAGSDVNTMMSLLKESALMEAAYWNHPRTARLLLEYGADYTKISSNGQTALDIAIIRYNIGIAALLRAVIAAEEKLLAPSGYKELSTIPTINIIHEFMVLIAKRLLATDRYALAKEILETYPAVKDLILGNLDLVSDLYFAKKFLSGKRVQEQKNKLFNAQDQDIYADINIITQE